MKLNLLLTFSQIFSKAGPILLAILFFGFMIFIHEFGHFFFAKLFKVKVNEFALGMGPVILKKRGKQTQYSLRLFPIGGFVSMEGEDEDSTDENAFCNKKIWQRMIITAAGAVNNIIFGAVICMLLIAGVGSSQSQNLVGTTTIGAFREGAVSCNEGGLMVGDKILKIDSKHVFTDRDVYFLMQRNNTGKFSFLVERDGEKVELSNVGFATRTGGNFAYSEDCVLSSVSSKLKRAGIKDGDKVLSINGKEIKNADEISEAVNSDSDYTVDITVLRGEEEKTFTDVKLMTVTVYDIVMMGQYPTFSNVFVSGLKLTATMSRMVYLSLFDMLSGEYGFSDLSGPIGTVSVIADYTEQSVASMDWSLLLMLVALITINIGLFNLLPIPALDGGRLFFMFIELVIRRRVPPKYENWIHAAGLVLMLIFMAVISASDIWKLVSGVGFI